MCLTRWMSLNILQIFIHVQSQKPSRYVAFPFLSPLNKGRNLNRVARLGSGAQMPGSRMHTATITLHTVSESLLLPLTHTSSLSLVHFLTPHKLLGLSAVPNLGPHRLFYLTCPSSPICLPSNCDPYTPKLKLAPQASIWEPESL